MGIAFSRQLALPFRACPRPESATERIEDTEYLNHKGTKDTTHFAVPGDLCAFVFPKGLDRHLTLRTSAFSAALRLIEPTVERDDVEEAWTVASLSGRFVALTGGADSAGLTAAAGLILQAQRAGNAAAWIGGRGASFYPPDFAASGIDLEALPVVRAPNVVKGARAADTLLRSGGFALIVLDLDADAELPLGMQSRLAGLAKKHGTALVCLARRRLEQPRRGSLVAVRVETSLRRVDFDRFVCTLRAVKDKRRAAGWDHVEVCRGPDGLC